MSLRGNQFDWLMSLLAFGSDASGDQTVALVVDLAYSDTKVGNVMGDTGTTLEWLNIKKNTSPYNTLYKLMIVYFVSVPGA